MNSAAPEVELTREYTISVLLGGMSMPEGAEAMFAAAENLGSYPSFFCSGAMVEPTAAAAATADPLTAPNMAFAPTLAWANEPGNRPTITFAALTSRSAMPP